MSDANTTHATLPGLILGGFDRAAKSAWKQWNPGLQNNEYTLQQVIDTLPGNPPEDISPLVKLFENPESPIAFKGAIDLQRHDCVHIVLGRGLLPQDEAFVIGFTMGTSKALSSMESFLFSVITRYLYPHPYKFDECHVKVLKHGMECGKRSKCRKIYEFPFENNPDIKLGDLRKLLGFNVQELRRYYVQEAELVADSAESQRLDVG